MPNAAGFPQQPSGSGSANSGGTPPAANNTPSHNDRRRRSAATGNPPPQLHRRDAFIRIGPVTRSMTRQGITTSAPVTPTEPRSGTPNTTQLPQQQQMQPPPFGRGRASFALDFMLDMLEGEDDPVDEMSIQVLMGPNGPIAFGMGPGLSGVPPFMSSSFWMHALFGLVTGLMGDMEIPLRTGNVDVENVMRGPRIQNTIASIKAMRAAFRTPIMTDKALEEMIGDLEAMRSGTKPTPARLQEERFGVKELDHAWRALNGDASDQLAREENPNRTPPLKTNPMYTLGDGESIGALHLLALGLTAIRDHKNPAGPEATLKDQSSMREALYWHVGQCIDRDDAKPDVTFRVCLDGITQNLVTPFQKIVDGVNIDSATFVPNPDEAAKGEAPNVAEELPMTNPGELLNEFAKQFRRDNGEAQQSQEKLNEFRDAARARARFYWPASSKECKRFDEHLDIYLKDDLGWLAPDPDAMDLSA